MMNPDGKCYVFDERGRGYGRGEGAGVVVLKRLDYARRDGDTVHAIIANSGVNQDGKTVGISLPSADAQAILAKSVYSAAGLDPGRTLYVEAHGTVSYAFISYCSHFTH
jgi:acyl transferase domain-containing protein